MDSIALRFVRIRSIQMRRELAAAGFFRSVILVFLALSAVYLFGFSQLQSDSALYGVIAVAAGALLVHAGRNDHQFIRHQANAPWQVYFAEYLAGSVILIVTGILLGSWYALLIVPCLLVVSNIPVKGKTASMSGRSASLIPLSLFEWRAGFRRNRTVIIILYTAMVLLVPLPYVSLALAWLIAGMISSFYQESEGREILEASAQSSAGFLRQKLTAQTVAMLLVLGLPLLVHGLLCQREFWFVLLAVLMLTINVMLFVVTKYAFWNPGSRGGAHEIVFSVAVISILIPFLLPLPLFFLIRNYLRASRKLRTVFND